MVGELGSASVKITLDDAEFKRGLSSSKSELTSTVSEMETKASGFGSKFGTLIAGGAAIAGTALVGLGVAGTKTYMDIESAAADAASKMDIGKIAQESGQTTKQAFDGVKEHVMQLADELGQLNTNAFDPTQIAAACAQLAAGGFDVASASGKDLNGILAMATGTSYDLSSSAKLTMSTMNQFGMSVGDIGKITDTYTVAAGKSAATMEDFDYAMQQAGPVAKGVGVSFETLTAMISKMADMGYKGEKSGTALRTAMLKLTSPTKNQTDALAKMGLSYADVDPKVHSFTETLKNLIAHGADIYDFGEIFGVEGASVVFSTAQQMGAIEDLTQTLVNSKGAAEEMAKMMLDSLSGSFQAAYGAASSLAYMVGGTLAPTLKAAFDWFSAEGAPAIRAFITAFQEAPWETLVSTISGAMVRVGEAIVKAPWGTWAQDAIIFLANACRGAIESFFAITSWITAKVTDWVNSGGPAALGKSIGDVLMAAVRSAISGSPSLWTIVTGLLSTAASWASLGIQIALGIAQGLIGSLTSSIPAAANTIYTIMAGVATRIQNAFITAWNAIVAGLSSAISSITSMVSSVVSSITSSLSSVTSAIGSLSGSSGVAGGTYVEGSGWVDNNRLSSFLAENNISMDKVRSGASSVYNSAKSAVKSGVNYVGSGIGSLLNNYAPSWLSSAYSSLTGYATGTETTGPEMALIGEAGTEYVIPTKTKRWDLLFKAMKAYGIPMMAEGGEAGAGVSGTPAEASGITATFGLTGLAAMSKSVQKILNNLKDFFRITWGVIKSEAQQDWIQINKVVVGASTEMRDKVWQNLINMRDDSINEGRNLVTGMTAQAAALWPAMSSGIGLVVTNSVNAFNIIGLVMTSTINNALTTISENLNTFTTQWNSVWNALQADLTSVQAKLNTAVTQIQAALAKIGVSLNITNNFGSGGGSGGGGGGSGGSYEGGINDNYESSGTAEIGKMTLTGNGANFGDMTCTGVVQVNALKYTNPSGVTNYINPMTFLSSGGISGYQGSSSNTGGSSYSGGGNYLSSQGYQLPSIFRAKGALEDEGARQVIVGEAGPELILPAKYTNLFTAMADDYRGSASSAGSSQATIVVENNHYWNGRKVVDLVMTETKRKLQQKGTVSSK